MVPLFFNNLTSMKKECIRIPFDIDSWTVTNNQVIYFAKDVFGEYDLETNILSVCYGTDSSLAATYRAGRGASIFSLNKGFSSQTRCHA